MSLLNLTSFALPTLLLQGAFDISFWTTKDQYAAGHHSMLHSDEEYKKGNMSGAIHHFYSAYAPTAEDEEKEYVLQYLQDLHIGGTVTTQATKSKIHAEVQCLVFGLCGQPDIMEDKVMIKREVESADSAQISWVFSSAHRVARKTVEELAIRFAQGYMTDRINDYLRTGSPRSYCYNGACLSWHHDIANPWNYAYAAAVLRDALASQAAAQYISAKGFTNYPSGVQAFCVSNRPDGC